MKTQQEPEIRGAPDRNKVLSTHTDGRVSKGTKAPTGRAANSKQGTVSALKYSSKVQNPEYKTCIVSLSWYKLLTEGMNEQKMKSQERRDKCAVQKNSK